MTEYFICNTSMTEHAVFDTAIPFSVLKLFCIILVAIKLYCIPFSSGKVLQLNARGIPDFAVVPIDGFPVDKTVNSIVTNAWLVSMIISRAEC